MIFAPACTRWRAYVAMYSGLAMYMLRPPTSRGMPAFGCALSLRRVCGAIFSMQSRIVCGPTEQLSPMTSAPSASSACTTSSGDAPYGVRQSAPIVICAMIGLSGATDARGANRLLDLLEIAERLEDEQIDAAFDETFDLLAEEFARFVLARRTVRLEAHAERADGAGDERAIARCLLARPAPRRD